jgi:hypothetical protein
MSDQSDNSNMCDSDNESNYDIEDILDKPLTSKENLVSILKNINLLLDTSTFISLMKDDVEYQEYNRSYNYYYVNEDNKKHDNEDTIIINYENKLKEINNMTKNVIKISRILSDDIIDCITYMIEKFITDVIEYIPSYCKTGKYNCLHDCNYTSYKILMSLSNEEKITKIPLYYDKELEKRGYIDHKTFMNYFINY